MLNVKCDSCFSALRLSCYPTAEFFKKGNNDGGGGLETPGTLTTVASLLQSLNENPNPD